MQDNKSKNIIIISIIITVLAVTTGIAFLLMIKSGADDSVNDIIYLDEEYLPAFNSDNYVFTSYEDLQAKLPDVAKITPADFQQHNYAYVSISYDGCSEKNVEVLGYKVTQNIITIRVQYEQTCGGCALDYINYLIPIDKDITSVQVEYDRHATKSEACRDNVVYKPIIYLYPEQETEVSVTLGRPEDLTTTYPKYDNGWHVLAQPSGDLTDLQTDRSLYSLYWEGGNYLAKVHDTGFIVKGTGTANFLEEKLALLGLTEREANEFIIYWLPKMEHNAYNYIYFATSEEINQYMPLTVAPQPDTVIRVMMEFQPLENTFAVKEQSLPSTLARNGFTVVEWGGSIINE